jgi:chorismate dehydratase
MPMSPLKIAAVSFLNSKPLIHYLLDRPDVHVDLDVPSRLIDCLHCGHADAGLVPVVDWAQSSKDTSIVSDGCIASDGTTLTVRVFCQCPPQDVCVIHADTDSHTSVMLARVLWQKAFGKQVRVEPLTSLDAARQQEAVLLIGDKVISQWREAWPHQVDFGELWKELTGLPFVFAVWVARKGIDRNNLGGLLSEARDRGCKDARRLATIYGPERGWPLPVAEEYLTRYMKYRLDVPSRQGLQTFIDMAAQMGLLQPVEAVTHGCP